MVPVTVAMSILFVTMTPLGAPETQKEQLNVYFKAKEIHTSFTVTLIKPQTSVTGLRRVVRLDKLTVGRHVFSLSREATLGNSVEKTTSKRPMLLQLGPALPW